MEGSSKGCHCPFVKATFDGGIPFTLCLSDASHPAPSSLSNAHMGLQVAGYGYPAGYSYPRLGMNVCSLDLLSLGSGGRNGLLGTVRYLRMKWTEELVIMSHLPLPS